MLDIILKITGLKKLMNKVLKTTKLVSLNQMTIVKKLKKIEKDIVKLKKDSHAPIFKEETYQDLDTRITVIEAFFDNIEKINDDYEKNVAN